MVFRVLLAVVSLTVLGLTSAPANQTGNNHHENAFLSARSQGRIAGPDACLPKFHSNLLGPDAVAFFLLPIPVPSRPVSNLGIPVKPHLPLPPPSPHPSSTPIDTAARASHLYFMRPWGQPVELVYPSPPLAEVLMSVKEMKIGTRKHGFPHSLEVNFQVAWAEPEDVVERRC
jgi:hypothetical protein